MHPFSPRQAPSTNPQPKILARACRFCRNRKTKCDTQKPRCGTCISHNRQCVYALEPPKKRPSTTLVNALEEQKAALERCIITLKFASPEERTRVLDLVTVNNGKVHLPDFGTTRLAEPSITPLAEPRRTRTSGYGSKDHEDTPGASSDDDDDYDPSSFLTMDERGQVGIYGPTSALHGSSPAKSHSNDTQPSEPLRNQLIANAALQRQKEHSLSRLPTIAGEPTELAIHLLDLHWNRQHHTFLLTYRPAIMRDLVTGGLWSSDFLLNAIFACVSKFSDRIEVRDSPSEPETAGRRFFNRCEDLMTRDSLLTTSSLPTIVGLLLLGSTFNASGKASKSWLYTGCALRMVYDMGLHLDCKEVGGSPEDVEIRRRVFWGAFILDKLQSLYLGRPITMQLRDAHVSRDFMDTIEENELWTPYMDPKFPESVPVPCPAMPTPVYSISTFQQMCLLSRIMARIINRFYVIGATADNTRRHLQSIDDALASWYKNLPPHLVFEPWSKVSPPEKPTIAAPNVIILLTTFNALIILLHRPFIFDGHLRPTHIPAASWKQCSTAARNITSLVSAYRKAFSLRRAPYLLSYAVYNACTIHARNTAATEHDGREENTSALILSLQCLDELTVPNSGVSNPASIIRRLAAANGMPNTPEMTWDGRTPQSHELDALCRMLPPSPPNFTDFTQTQSLTAFGSYGYNSLHDFMDTYMPDLHGDFLNGRDGMN